VFRSAVVEGLEARQMSEFPETEEEAARFFGFDKGVNNSMLITKESKNAKKTLVVFKVECKYDLWQLKMD
jgi:hypothetical protein